jgi:DNA-binding NarL/FixJ family response regulator
VRRASGRPVLETSRSAMRDMEEVSQVSVLVVDDQTWFREVMRDVVAAADSFRLVGEADSGEAAIEAVDRLAPGLVIMDKRMPGMGGVEACRAISERHPDVVVLICSVEDPDPALMRECGASACVRKHRLSARLLREVWQIHGVRRR